MSAGSRIRPYAPADEEAVVALWSAASKKAHPFIDDEGQGERERKLRDVYLKIAESWVIEDEGGRVVGLLGLLDQEIGGLFVDPAAQGAGYGRALVEHAVKLKGEVTLEVFEKNAAARAFYAHMGFILFARRNCDETGHMLLKLVRPVG